MSSNIYVKESVVFLCIVIVSICHLRWCLYTKLGNRMSQLIISYLEE